LIKEITASSQEQSIGANEINSAIIQLSNVVQQNSAAAEELSASAKEMHFQAEQLRKIMKFFKIDKESNQMKDLIAQIEELDNESAKLRKELWTYSKPDQQDIELDIIASDKKEKKLEFEQMECL